MCVYIYVCIYVYVCVYICVCVCVCIYVWKSGLTQYNTFWETVWLFKCLTALWKQSHIRWYHFTELGLIFYLSCSPVHGVCCSQGMLCLFPHLWHNIIHMILKNSTSWNSSHHILSSSQTPDILMLPCIYLCLRLSWAWNCTDAGLIGVSLNIYTYTGWYVSGLGSCLQLSLLWYHYTTYTTMCFKLDNYINFIFVSAATIFWFTAHYDFWSQKDTYYTGK